MSRAQASLLGGLFIGILSTLPIVNLCCCLWVVVGGVLTTYLLQQGRSVTIEPSEAVMAGLFAGLIGAVISLAFSFFFFSMSGDVVETQMREALERYPQMPPDVRDRMLTLMAGPGFVLLLAVVTVPVYAVVGMLGALLGRIFFRRPPPQAAQI